MRQACAPSSLLRAPRRCKPADSRPPAVNLIETTPRATAKVNAGRRSALAALDSPSAAIVRSSRRDCATARGQSGRAAPRELGSQTPCARRGARHPSFAASSAASMAKLAGTRRTTPCRSMLIRDRRCTCYVAAPRTNVGSRSASKQPLLSPAARDPSPSAKRPSMTCGATSNPGSCRSSSCWARACRSLPLGAARLPQNHRLSDRPQAVIHPQEPAEKIASVRLYRLSTTRRRRRWSENRRRT